MATVHHALPLLGLTLFEHTQPMLDRIEHPQVFLGLKFGENGTKFVGPAHGRWHVIHSEVQVCLDLLLTLH